MNIRQRPGVNNNSSRSLSQPGLLQGTRREHIKGHSSRLPERLNVTLPKNNMKSPASLRSPARDPAYAQAGIFSNMSTKNVCISFRLIRNKFIQISTKKIYPRIICRFIPGPVTPVRKLLPHLAFAACAYSIYHCTGHPALSQ